jgi:dephospho-CoA kinase
MSTAAFCFSFTKVLFCIYTEFMEKRIIGLVGPIASGKGTSAEYCKEKYNAEVFRFSSLLRSMVDTLGMPADREHLSRLSLAIRQEFGDDTLALALASQVSRSQAHIIIVDGIRRPGDLSELASIPGFTLVYIDAPMEKRYERIIQRGENVDDGTKTYEAFAADHERESELLIAGLKDAAAVACFCSLFTQQFLLLG